MFRVPGSSSSPPLTPDKKRNPYALPDPSTTPAGPPPTSYTAPSTTPAGPPPSSVFGSAKYIQPIHFGASSAALRNPHRASPSRLRHATLRDEDDNEDAMDEDHDFGDSILSGDDVIPSVEGLNTAALAKALAIKPAGLPEDDGLILDTETVVGNLFAFANGGQHSDNTLDLALDTAVESLLGSWKQYADAQQQQIGIGPGPNVSPVTKSLFLASLLLPLHHAPRRQQGASKMRSSRQTNQVKPIPEVLLDWLKVHHNQYPQEFMDTLNTEPNPCAHERFWDVVLSLTLRGDVANSARLLKEADFRHAVSALEDGADEPGYRGKQLGNVQRVVNRAIIVLESCPAVSLGDWNVKGPDWSIFRRRVSQALSDLEAFAEGSSVDRPVGGDEALEASNFGLASVRSDDLAISTMSRRAESKVPWSIYQNLNYLYGQLLGTRREIVAAAADWVEATIALAVWWDGEQDEEAKSNLASSRRSLNRSLGPRDVDTLPKTAYQQKLALSLQQVTSENEDAELQINTNSPIQLGLACIFENDLQGLLDILQGWSWPIATAVAEIAQLGSWLNMAPNPSRSLMQGFDKSDLMVLSFAQQPDKGVRLDDILVPYAERLYARPKLQNPRTNTLTDGWELAIQVLSRLDNAVLAESRISEFLNELDLMVSDRVEKVLTLCSSLRLPTLAESISEKYADQLAAETDNYGGALYYYARAHNAARVAHVINVLISCCIVQSIAFPPRTQLDSTLASIISAPKKTLARFSMLDRDAAEILSSQLSGYAMLRKFYELRDQTMTTSGQQSTTLPIARSKEAAAALVAVIESAGDSIHGGLYDASTESVVQVDVLLALLGEALVFLNQPNRVLTISELSSLMQAAEDISTISSTIYEQCEEVLKAALLHAHSGDTGPPPRALLGKSTSALKPSMMGSSSEFSLIGSNLTSVSGSKHMTDSVRRAWDWRMGVKKESTGQDVIKILRLGLAQEVSRVWTEGDN